jgi:hydroxyacylglutathione hydrolase
MAFQAWLPATVASLPGREWTGGAVTARPIDIDFVSGAPVAGDLDVRWIHGAPSPRHDTDPEIQVHAYDQHTFVLRQSKAVHFEAPFMYLLCGNDRALLLDTGATGDPSWFPLRATVDGILDRWLAAHPRSGYELVVAHSHAHGDHIAGDGQFAGRPGTTVVGTDLDSVRSFFGIADWPEQIVQFDLGGRVLDVISSPGHHDTSISVYDPWSGFLLTGDSVYPGRLYVRDPHAFAASIDRLVDFARSHAVTHVMGCHIEQRNRPRKDYPIKAGYQPDEPPLQMTVEQLAEVGKAAAAVADRPGVHRFDDFSIFNGPCTRTVPLQLARIALGRLRDRAIALRRPRPRGQARATASRAGRPGAGSR